MKCVLLMNKINAYFVSWLLASLRYTIAGTTQLTHIRDPIQLSIGECISFEASPSFIPVGNWIWKKDTIAVKVSDSNRITIAGKILTINDAEIEDSAYYSAEVQTSIGRKELFKFWLNVEGCGSNEKKNPYVHGKCHSWCQKKCEQGWNHFDGRCYKYFGEVKSWEDALDKCQAQDARLAVVDDKKKNEFVGSLLESGEGAWIGLNDRYTESLYMWNNDKNDKAKYFLWAKNEPSNTNKACNIENCVEMKYPGLTWNDMICNGYNSYVCQVNKDSKQDSSWSCYESICYKYFATQVIWKDSKMKCEELGGGLARVTSSSINTFVGDIIQSNIWIGLNDIVEPGTYVWEDSTVGKLSDKTSFFNWDNGEPNDKLYNKLFTERCSGEDCVQMNKWDNVTWNDIECSTKLPYVCEKNRNSLLTLAAALGITVGCTAVTIIIAAFFQSRLKNRKHKVQTQKLTFHIQHQ